MGWNWGLSASSENRDWIIEGLYIDVCCNLCVFSRCPAHKIRQNSARNQYLLLQSRVSAFSEKSRLKDEVLIFAAIFACFLVAQPRKSAKILQEMNIYSFNRDFRLFQKNLDWRTRYWFLLQMLRMFSMPSPENPQNSGRNQYLLLQSRFAVVQKIAIEGVDMISCSDFLQ